MKTCGIGGFLLALSLCCAAAQAPQAPAPAPAAYQAVPIAPIWSGFIVNPALLTHGDDQFVAFYDIGRRMTLGQRKLGSTAWKFKILPTTLGWDSHNYIALGLDRDNCLHISGNMHAAPLVYFRSRQPLDIDSVERDVHMVGPVNEDRVTYPVFLHGPGDALVFMYREGVSGNGNSMLNIYNEKDQTWSRLLDTPLFDGEGKANSYPATAAPVKGPDGYFYISYLWRTYPDAAFCCNLSLIRSRDLVHWEGIDGTPLTLPVTQETTGVMVDPIPVKGGIVNGFGKVGFGPNNEVVLSYAKFDAEGKTQLYLARAEQGKWKIYQASAWSDRYEFNGGGTIPDAGIGVSAIKMVDGKITIPIYHKRFGSGLWEIDPATLKLKGMLPYAQYADFTAPPELAKPASTFPEMRVYFVGDTATDTGAKGYKLRVETLPPNRDLPRQPPFPEPTMLQLIEYPKKNP